MLISTTLLLDSIIRNSVCTPAKLPCRRVEVGYDLHNNNNKTSVVRIGVRNGRERRKNVGTTQHLLVLVQGRPARFRHLAGCGRSSLGNFDLRRLV
jgi:hypothetical protein